jgi:nitrite reductase/ring-hydroxylating ferredoxin subunit
MLGHSIRLCSIKELKDGKSRGLDPLGEGRDSVFVVRQGDDVRAYLNVCPHQGARLAWRKDEYLNRDGTKIVCYAHGAQFDIETGACTLGPALGQSLQRIAVTIGTDGMIRAIRSEFDDSDAGPKMDRR